MTMKKDMLIAILEKHPNLIELAAALVAEAVLRLAAQEEANQRHE